MARGFDRRTFICGGCAAVTLTACAPEPPGPLDTGRSTADTDETTDPSTTDLEYPCGQDIEPGGARWTALPLSEYPDLAEVGGWYAVNANGTQIVVAHATEGCYSAIERACAHEGAPINYVPERGQYVCPRHGAVYDWAGEKVSGPQPTGLPVYPCGRVDDTIWVRV